MSGAAGTKRKHLRRMDADASEDVLNINKLSENDLRVFCD